MTGFWRLNFCWSWSMNSSQSLALKNIQSATWKCLLNRPEKWHRSDYIFIWPVPANHGPPAEDTNRFESARDFEICWSKIWKIFGPGPWISDRYLIFTCLEILSISFVQFPCPSDKQQLSCILYRNYCTAYRYQIRGPFFQDRFRSLISLIFRVTFWICYSGIEKWTFNVGGWLAHWRLPYDHKRLNHTFESYSISFLKRELRPEVFCQRVVSANQIRTFRANQRVCSKHILKTYQNQNLWMHLLLKHFR